MGKYENDSRTIAANRLCSLFPILPSGEGRPSVLFPGTKPETVYNVIIRPKGREILDRGKSAQISKKNGVSENIPSPCGKTGFYVSPVKDQGKKDEGTQDLRLIFSRMFLRGIEMMEIIY
ncbi:hypothetical protein [Mordavella massiliensis]|uniref:hypothetical protein n=1 Tax=Mordavella massiliensis TaxID=1871024 RepID=UPI00210DF1B6|nr:hypothetical protein [Mordavella massiliensis]